MKRILLSITTILFISLSSFAQYRLQTGEDDFRTVVSRPYFFYDLMRDQNVSWIRQYRINPLMPWSNSNKLINKKGADGRFEHLEYSIWNFEQAGWTVYNSYENQRQFNQGQTISEHINTLFMYDENVYTTDVLYEHAYTGSRITSSACKYTFQNGNESWSSLFLSYNDEGKLLCDSEVYSNGISLRRYIYNSEGKCTSEFNIYNGDTTSRIEFGYSGNKLINYSYIPNTQNGFTLSYREEYAYDNNGRLSTATLSELIGDTLLPFAIYRHGYDGNSNKLSWMSNDNFSDGEWTKADSVVITYTANKADTSYGYLSANGQTWDSYPSFRFLFDDLHTGVKENGTQKLPVSIFPNPASHYVYVNTEAGNEIENITISDMAGRTAQKISRPGNRVDISALSKGLYIMNIYSTGGTATQKLLIE